MKVLSAFQSVGSNHKIFQSEYTMTDIEFINNYGVFSSDNFAGAHPKIMESVAKYSTGFAPAYGDDELTARVMERIEDVFEHECAVFFVGTGTAANSLALAALCPPHGGIYCHPVAHINTDECAAPEMYTGGAKLIEIDGEHGKMDAALLASRLSYAEVHGIHNVKPSMISLTNATEYGTVYSPAEIGALAEIGQQYGMKMHIDGARFANAVVSLDASPAELTWQSGVDVITFGATKNGAFAAEAVVFFDLDDAEEFGFRRKRAGQLWSKHRFISAQFEAYLADDLWLEMASHSNSMAQRMAEGLSELPGVVLNHPVEANELFPSLPEKMIVGLEEDGFSFYRWPGTDPGMLRLVTSFVTRQEEVEDFLASARKHA